MLRYFLDSVEAFLGVKLSPLPRFKLLRILLSLPIRPRKKVVERWMSRTDPMVAYLTRKVGIVLKGLRYVTTNRAYSCPHCSRVIVTEQQIMDGCKTVDKPRVTHLRFPHGKEGRQEEAIKALAEKIRKGQILYPHPAPDPAFYAYVRSITTVQRTE